MNRNVKCKLCGKPVNTTKNVDPENIEGSLEQNPAVEILVAGDVSMGWVHFNCTGKYTKRIK